MIIPDANLLLYAYDRDCLYHSSAKEWLETVLSGTELVGFTYPVLFAFLRIATSGKVYRNPMSVTEAREHTSVWKKRSNTTVLEPHQGYLEEAGKLLIAAGSSGGNLVIDAQIAAIAVNCKGVVHTTDRDFLRFPDLKTFFPLDA
ncbi:MAG: TA system VapC family ribonuclease toxin [Spirochaetota bacterium]